MKRTGQMRMLREARKVGKPGQMLELVDMAGVLLDSGFPLEAVAQGLDLPVQGGVTKLARLMEALDVARAWPEEALLFARRYDADWHALREPARWWRNGDVEREQVITFALGFAERVGRWPRVDDLRREFGKEAGHKGPGDDPGQGQLEDAGEPYWAPRAGRMGVL